MIVLISRTMVMKNSTIRIQLSQSEEETINSNAAYLRTRTVSILMSV